MSTDQCHVYNVYCHVSRVTGVMCRIVTTTATLTNRRAQQLHCHYWKGQQRRCLVFLSHGFSEHLGLYHEVATVLYCAALYCTVLYCAVLYLLWSQHYCILDSKEGVAVVSGEKHGDDATYVLGHECRDN